VLFGIEAKVHDAYIDGEDILEVSVPGFERLVDISGFRLRGYVRTSEKKAII
jgi:hypothetical protein